MSTAVSAFLLKHNFVRHLDVEVLAEAILDDMNKGLMGLEADQDMIPTWCLPPEQRAVGKSVIVIDAGGTNFRSCLVAFDENGNASISEMEKTKMPGVERELSKKEFFDQFANNLEHLKNKADRIGFCFSYPMRITEDGDGVLLGFSKEVKAPEVAGCKVGKELKEALKAHGWNEIRRVTMLNDTVAALLAGAAAPSAGCRYSSYIGFILGTGLNAAYIQNEIKERNFQKQIVVCESGKMNKVVLSDFDAAFDKKSARPGVFHIEKQCSGAYLGFAALEILHSAAEEKLFSEKMNASLRALQTLTLIELDSFLHSPYGDGSLAKLAASNASEDDYDILFELLDAVVERSARSAAAILIAAVVQSGEGKHPTRPVCILCNGTTFYKTRMIKARVEGLLDEHLTRRRSLYWETLERDNDITLGTAIAGLL
ncbi:MAG: hexokinase [Treponema sp.]